MKIYILLFLLLNAITASVQLPRFCGCEPGYPPVCASDFQTYGNECEMHCDNSQLYVIYRGTCEQLWYYINKQRLLPSPWPVPGPEPYPWPIPGPVPSPWPVPGPLPWPVPTPGPVPYPPVPYPPVPYPPTPNPRPVPYPPIPNILGSG